jgi:vancomycin resistance protein YoaR
VFAPHYVPPGRDAAVAQPNIDLRFRNPYPWPIRLHTISSTDRLDIRILGERSPTASVEITNHVLARIDPVRLTRVVHRPEGQSGRAFIRNPGATGYRVTTYRVFSKGGTEIRSERLSDDTYEAMNRIVQVNEPL